VTPHLKVIEPGLATTVQDRGRFGYQHVGVPISGPLDPIAFRLANVLVGNPENTGALEIRLLGPTLRIETECVRVALCGTTTPLEILGAEARIIPSWRSVLLPLGSIFRIGALKDTSCCYLAVEGGFDVPSVLGSQSTFARGALGGFHGRALEPGDRVPLCRSDAASRRDVRLANPPDPDRGAPIRVVLGPQNDYFDAASIELFQSSEYTISRNADRMGMRLEGAALTHSKGYNISSDGITTGAIQVPGNGLPIVMVNDRQTTGGYPKIANVSSVDLPRLGRMKPMSRLRFQAIPVAEAEQLKCDQEDMIRGLFDTIEPLPDPDDPSPRTLRGANLISGVVGVAK
jgi:biotin-dependent carboxylase-like uncharacterized protein